MQGKLKKNKGITLIALVITIIVMLILAGVSLNAVIGENGIITKAQEATYLQSIAILEEYFSSLYVGNYQEMQETDSKITILKNINQNMFFKTALGYIIDSEGNKHYFINKDGLPEEIKKQLKGGDAGKKEYIDYASFNDCYGVTEDLKVYYCRDKERILGTTEFDKDNPTREVFAAGSDMAKLITGVDNKSVTAEDLKGVTKLTINTPNIKLDELYNFVSLNNLILENINLDSLKGIENALQINSITIKNCKINDYSSLAQINNLQSLGIYNTTDAQISILCDAIKNANYTNLKYFAIVDSTTNVTDVSKMAEFNDNIKKSIKTLYLYNNRITDISFLENFVNIIDLNISNNKNITTLTPGLKNMNNLERFISNDNNLGVNEIYNSSLENGGKNFATDSLSALENKNNLKTLDLSGNANLKWIGYIKNLNKIEGLYLARCTNFVKEEVKSIANIYNNVQTNFKSIDKQYIIYLNTSERLLYANMNLTDNSDEINALKNNLDCKQLDLSGNQSLTNAKLQEILSTMKNIENLKLSNISNLTSIEFVKNMPNLKEIILLNTSVEDLSFIDIYNLKIQSIDINNNKIDLTKIQNAMNRIYENYVKYGFNEKTMLNDIATYGVVLRTQNLWGNLSKCTNLTSLLVFTRSFETFSSWYCDLSNTKLENFRSYWTFVNFKFPETLTYLNVRFPERGFYADGSLCNKITKISCEDFATESIQYFEDSIKSLSTFPELTNLTLKLMLRDFNLDGFSKYKFEKLTNLEITGHASRICLTSIDGIKGLKDTLTSLKLDYAKDSVTGFSAIGECTKLTNLEITNTKLNDISFVKNLTELTNLNLSTNAISSCIPFTSLRKLVTLNLENNNIYDMSSELNEQGETVSYNNLEILLNLNKNGLLKNIYLANNNIEDYTIIKKGNWENKSGF